MTKCVPAFYLHWKFWTCAVNFSDTVLQVWVNQGNFKAGTESTPEIQNVCQLLRFSQEKFSPHRKNFNLNHTQKWKKAHLTEIHLVTKQWVKLMGLFLPANRICGFVNWLPSRPPASLVAIYTRLAEVRCIKRPLLGILARLRYCQKRKIFAYPMTMASKSKLKDLAIILYFRKTPHQSQRSKSEK